MGVFGSLQSKNDWGLLLFRLGSASAALELPVAGPFHFPYRRRSRKTLAAVIALDLSPDGSLSDSASPRD
jgi:hypothetical protein